MKKYVFLMMGFVVGILYVAACGTDVPSSLADAVVHAIDVVFDNAASGLTATNVQAAIEEVGGRVDTLEGNTPTASSLVGTWTFATPFEATAQPGSLTISADGTYTATTGFALDTVSFCSSGRFILAGGLLLFENSSCTTESGQVAAFSAGMNAGDLILTKDSHHAFVGTKS